MLLNLLKLRLSMVVGADGDCIRLERTLIALEQSLRHSKDAKTYPSRNTTFGRSNIDHMIGRTTAPGGLAVERIRHLCLYG